MVEVLIVEMFGSDRSRPTDYQRAVVVDGRGAKETRKTTLRSEWRSALKKSLTEPALLEMSGDACLSGTRINAHSWNLIDSQRLQVPDQLPTLCLR